MNMQEKAKQILVDSYNALYIDGKKEITKDDVYIVWFCKTLQNWKALASTKIPDGMYYEITHDGDKNKTYVDVYKKWDNFWVE